MTQEQLRMQMLAGIITEGEYKEKMEEIENYLSELDPDTLYEMVNNFFSDNDAWVVLKDRVRGNKGSLERWALAHIKDNGIELNDLKSMYGSV